jgi:predicted transcriptional regulator
MPSEKPRITVYLDEDLKEELEELARLNDRPVSNFVLTLIKQAITDAKAQGQLKGK